MNLSSVLSSPKGEGKSGKSHNDLFTYSPIALLSKKVAFTMAEILLSLTIIGVVAAITLPSLMGNINERTWNTQRKALHARMSQAIGMMPYLNGYGTVVSNGNVGYGDDGYSNITDTAAEAFVTEGLSKVLKINNICDADHLEDCGLSSTVYKDNGVVAYSSIPKRVDSYVNFTINDMGAYGVLTAPAAFETQNGESVLVYYNPQCSVAPPDWYGAAGDGSICANFIYDLNGSKGPNTAGKDIGVITAFYAVDSSVVAPMPKGTIATGAVTLDAANTYCRNNFGDATRLPNIEEAISLNYNVKLFSGAGGWTASNTVSSSDNTKVYAVFTDVVYLAVDHVARTSYNLDPIFCIER